MRTALLGCLAMLASAAPLSAQTGATAYTPQECPPCAE